jgi:hypothetical protein
MQAVAAELSGYAEKFLCLMHTNRPYADTPTRHTPIRVPSDPIYSSGSAA